MKTSKVRGGGIHRDLHKGGDGSKIQYIGTSNYFIVNQVMLLVVSDHFVKKIKRTPFPHKYIYFKVLWTGLYTLHCIRKSYEI